MAQLFVSDCRTALLQIILLDFRLGMSLSVSQEGRIPWHLWSAFMDRTLCDFTSISELQRALLSKEM